MIDTGRYGEVEAFSQQVGIECLGLDRPWVAVGLLRLGAGEVVPLDIGPGDGDPLPLDGDGGEVLQLVPQ